jgi:hypothetical protein
MAAEPIPMPENNTEVTINSDGSISGDVSVNNGGVVKFQVSSYPINPQTGSPYNQCIVTLNSSNISWQTIAAAGQSGITVGNGGH